MNTRRISPRPVASLLLMRVLADRAGPRRRRGSAGPTLVAMGASLVVLVALAAMLLRRAPSEGTSSPVPSTGKSPAAASGQPLVIYCAASNKSVMEAIRADYEREYGTPLAIQYAISCPAEYRPSEQLYPLLLLIPGIEDGKTESPKEHIIEYWKEQAILDSVIIAACPMPQDTELWDESGKEDAPGGVGLLLSILKEMLDNYAIDYDRIFLAGRGPGVAAALSIATKYPDRFAGVIGRAGDAGECVWENLRNLPTFFAGAGAAAGERTSAQELSRLRCRRGWAPPTPRTGRHRGS